MKKFTILLLLIALVGLFAWTYSKNIIITLLLLTVLGLIFDKIPVLLDKEKSSKEKMIACTLLVIFITSTILFTNKEIISDKYAKSSGSILGSLKDEKITRVLIDVGADFKFLKLPMIYTEGKPVFENFNIWIENNEVMLSSLIRNKTGKILARLEANEWQVKFLFQKARSK